MWLWSVKCSSSEIISEYLRAFSHNTFLDSDSTWDQQHCFSTLEETTGIEDSHAN